MRMEASTARNATMMYIRYIKPCLFIGADHQSFHNVTKFGAETRDGLNKKGLYYRTDQPELTQRPNGHLRRTF